MHPLAVLDHLKSNYTTYVDSFQFYKNPAIHAWVQAKRNQGRLLYREPFLTLAKPFAPGGTLADLVNDPDGLHPDVLTVFTKLTGDPTAEPIEPFVHQQQAITQILDGHNTTVTTGTGSGKSFTFYIPIVSAALRARDQRTSGFRAPLAVIIYPMNALANSQYEDIAARLAGSGLTVCNYTGDLKKTHADALRNFTELTGRDEPYDSEVIDRETLHHDGCDILLTNFKMLEYALVRRADSDLFKVLGEGGRMRYLVLDEMHTYSGRQGADMALLVRRFKERTGTSEQLICIGTSATVDSGDPAQAVAAIATFATHLFGEHFDPTHVVQESYGTPETADPANGLHLAPQPVPETALTQARNATAAEDVIAALAPHMLNGTDADAARQALPVAWVERELWTGVQSLTDLAHRYIEQVRPQVSVAEAQRDIEAALMLGTALTVPGPRAQDVGMITPKVHAFFSQGLPVTKCLRSDDTGHLSEQGESSCAACATEGFNDVAAFPMVFCGPCGQEYFVAARTGQTLVPRDFQGDVDAATPIYVMLDEWDDDQYPPNPDDIKRNGDPRKGREGAVPRRVELCTLCGHIDGGCGHDDHTTTATVVQQPFLMCPSCGVRYDGSNSEYNKFFQVGSVGRATATDVLIEGMLNEVDADTGKAQVMAFTDNQQDSSFQAAHLRSMSRRFHVRRAVLTALAGTGPTDARDTGEVAEAAFTAMQTTGTLPHYAEAPTARIVIGASTTDGKAAARYQRYLKAAVLMETTGQPRKSQPNLEDTGLVVVGYDGLERDATIEALLSPKHADLVGEDLQALAVSDPDLAYDLLRCVLDTMRRNRALRSSNSRGPAAVFADPLTFKSEVLEQISENAYFHSGVDTPRRPTVYDPRATSSRSLDVRRLAGHITSGTTYAPHTTTLVRWVRKEASTNTDGARALITQAEDFLDAASFLLQAHPGHVVAEERLRYWRADEPVGYRCPRCSSRWMFATARACPRCVKTTLDADRPGRDDFFRAQYTAPLGDTLRVEAHEHTGSLDGDQRKTIETRFKDPDDHLNVLVCTPTMELGVDIGSLSAVYMRNVPPSPANYAQRQGRAGRQAQPAMVVTFCSAQGRSGAHDQYFFKRPDRIITGKIAAPRFLLDNKALLRSHINAMILGAHGDFPAVLTAWVDLDAPMGGLTGDYRTELEQFITVERQNLIDRCLAAFSDVFAEAEAVDVTYVDEVVDTFVQSLHDDMAALVAYAVELREEWETLNAQANIRRLEADENRRRTALEAIREKIREGQGDYHPLAWLSTRGFLPTYAFPRRAVLLRFSDTLYPRVRSRAIALREFAPGNSVYHLGRRYQVTRTSQGSDAAAAVSHIIACECGYYLQGQAGSATSTCPECDRPTAVATEYKAALPVADAYAIRSENVGADSEERLRQGYRIESNYRLPTMGLRRKTINIEGAESIDATYAHLGDLMQVNTGLMRSTNKFTLCSHCRTWDPPDDHWDDGKDCAPIENRLQDVVIFNDGKHDMLLLDVVPPDGVDPEDFAQTLTYALMSAISAVFGIELNEIGAQVFPHPDAARPSGRRILLYETDEGGVGVLDRVADEDTWSRLAATALDILHVEPTGNDRSDACLDSCYECLRTFRNQWHHQHLDRRLVVPYLLQALHGVTITDVNNEEAWDAVISEFASATEEAMVRALQSAGVPAPSAAHRPVPDDHPIAEADLLYQGQGKVVVVFLDGGVHDGPIVQAADATKRAQLRDKGYQVVAIRHDAMEQGITELMRRLGIE